MAKKPMSTEEAERMNFVAQDQIWRCRLKAETEARQNWAQNWGFLTTPLQELVECEDKPLTPKPRIELPQSFRIRPVTPVEKYIKDGPPPLRVPGCLQPSVNSPPRAYGSPSSQPLV